MNHKITYCSRCLYNSEHPLNITFNKNQICSGCEIHEEKDTIDWNERFVKLKKIVNGYKQKNKLSYDCIVPISGGQDSFFIVDVVKKRLGLNPLLVSYNTHYNTLSGLRNLALIRTIFDCDMIQKIVQPQKIKRINLCTLKNLGSMYWHVLAGRTVFPVQVAVNLNIPLIIWGVHQGCDQVGMFSHYDEVEMTRKYRKEHDLMGFEAEDLINNFCDITEQDIDEFKYPSNFLISKVGVRGIYLSNYIRWDSKKQHEEMLKKYNYETVKQIRTADSYNNIDCMFYNGIHDYIKLKKCGYSKITDHVNREIRLKKLSREKGIEIVKEYQTQKTDDFEPFFIFNNISEKYFKKLIHKFINKKFWTLNNGKWQLKWEPNKNKKKNIIDNARLNSKFDFNFINNKKIKKENNSPYLLHKSWIENEK